MATKGRRKFSEYRREAKPEPFILVDDDGEEIVIDYPDTERLMDISETPQTQPRRMLAKICGDQFDQVWELVRHEPIEVVSDLVSDIAEHFGLANAQEAPGGSGASSG